MGIALQMTWQTSPLSQKRKSDTPLGLKNLGNTCYLNSVLQCLTYTPPLAHFCLKFLHSSSCDTAKISVSEKKSECPFCIIEKRISRSLSIDATLDSPVKINNCLKIFAEHFRNGRQEDAHEFLRYVIDACHNTCLRIKKLQQRRKSEVLENGHGNGDTVVKEIFGGALQSQVKCLSCGAESNKVDEIMDISLDVSQSGSLKEALKKFFQPEILDGNNKYKCENCKKLVAARKQMSILQAPNVLAIQFKRFEGIYGGKIDKAIGFEEVLVLSNYMCKASQDLHPEYNLFATIVHSGFSADSGHYYAYIKDAIGRWYCCNDSFVSLSSLEEVLSEKVYILFFSRTKQRPPLLPLLSNGTKSHDSNGSEDPKTQVSEPHLITSKVKDLPILPNNLSQSEKPIFRKPPSANNVKILLHKKQSLDKNGHTQTINGNNKISSLSNGNGKMHTTKSGGLIEEDKENTKIMKPNNPDKEFANNGNESGLKRKLQDKEEDRCILLAKDDKSRTQVDKFKEIIGKDAYMFLQSCGWADKVHNFMYSNKKLCKDSLSNNHDLKKKLIADAKSAFIPQIPQSLKGSLIESLKSFVQEK